MNKMLQIGGQKKGQYVYNIRFRRGEQYYLKI